MAWQGLCISSEFDLWEVRVIIPLKVNPIHHSRVRYKNGTFREKEGDTKPNCPFSVCFIGNKVECQFFSTISAAPINEIIYYSITLFVNALKSSLPTLNK